jgi:serine/threonine protein kinase
MAVPSTPEEEIFLHVLELPEAAREDFVCRTCGDDGRLRSAVDALLADHGRATALFDDAAGHLKAPADEAPGPDLAPGTLVGSYRILRRLGEGGGGVVYEADQEAPVRRKVALKLFKLDLDQKRVIARFEAERQTLALMEHPNIARVLDAGSTEAGRPYFVMDLVHGAKITDYCTLHHAPLQERLRLMQQVCAAVQHAHQKGVIHHDLKPSNILVAEIDGTPVPKVIDFGIAKVLEATNGAGPDCAIQDQLVGTPAYMSPEQFQGRAMDVDTRSDIYSLGVVLYELLVGRPPFDNDELLRAGVDEIKRRIVHEKPRRPSERGSSIRRELDWIVLKALEKDRERRYATVRAFAADIECYLAHKPLDAHPPSRWYRLRKLVRRNRLASAASTIAALALLAGFTTSTLLYLRARVAEQQQARLRAEAEEREHVTRAAILLMQSRTEEADAEIRLMGGVLTQPSVEASHVFHTLGLWSAMNGDWKTSAARWLALSRVNRFDDRDMTDNATRDLLPVAPTLLEAGDVAGYDAFRELLIARLGGTNNPIAAEQVLKICLHRPATVKTLAGLAPIAAVAERSLPGGFAAVPDNWLDAWRCIALGLWHLRSGRNDEAIRWCDRALLLPDGEEARQTVGRIVRGLARLRSGADRDAAEADLAAARSSVQRRFATRLDYGTGGYWHDWLCARLLLQEAE